MSQNVCCICFLLFFFGGGGGWIIFYFNFLSELSFPTWLFAFSKVSFKLSEYVIIDTHTLLRWGCSSLFPYTAITEIRNASTAALSCCTRSPMTLSQSQPPIISHQTVGSPDTSPLWYTDRYPHSRTTINTLSFPEQSYIRLPSQPSYHCFLPWHSLVMLCAR